MPNECISFAVSSDLRSASKCLLEKQLQIAQNPNRKAPFAELTLLRGSHLPFRSERPK